MIAALTPLTNALSDLISFATNIINMFVALFTGDFTGACEFADAALQDLEKFFRKLFRCDFSICRWVRRRIFRCYLWGTSSSWH